ncbi:MAG: prepilin-type N-terminal cleavage/methylation domain-containing protein [Burkholderiales bacterium]
MKRKTALKASANDQGFSLVEVLVSMLLIVVALVPALQALQSGVQAAKIDIEFTQQTPAAKMEQMLARSFAALALAATGGSTASVGSNTTKIPEFDPTLTLGTNLTSQSLPAGPGLSDDQYNIYIDCLDPATGATLIAGPCKNLLRIRVVSKTTGQQLVSYKAQ